MSKVKFKVNLIVPQKKFSFVLGTKKKYRPGLDFFKLKLNRTLFTKRIQFLLSLICEKSTEISFRFCDTEEMISSNFQFRSKNYLTDVLSFPGENTNPYEHFKIATPLARNKSKSQSYELNEYNQLGDILICVGVCELQAKKYGSSFAEEMERLMIHGLVHLKGFDHERNISACRVMEQLEASLLKEMNSKLGKAKWLQKDI